ncbi:MAG: diphthine--ammonia ligase [Candidatus Woesearchaeota archaeon]
MKVAILFSGGKDSSYAIESCLEKGWKIAYLLSVKPTRKDCYLFHYATVEHTPLQAKLMGLRHILTTCDVADPTAEAKLVREIVESMQKKEKIEALVLGGTGLQLTQLRSIQKALQPLGISVFAAHEGREHGELMKEMLDKGYVFMITQVASEGLGKWLGSIVTKENFAALLRDAHKYGFHIGFEGGYADTFCLDSPLFAKKIDILEMEKCMEDELSGHIVFKKFMLSDKSVVGSAHTANLTLAIH